MMNKNFNHLHVHTYYSLLDGLSSPKSLAAKAKSLGMSAIAITDHNHIGGCFEFQDACKKEGIKPILGGELYYTNNTSILNMSAEDRFSAAVKSAMEDGVEIPSKIDGKKPTKKQMNEVIENYLYDTKQYHILFLAMNQTGWNNLVKLQSEASKVCTYNGRFLCDTKMIKKYSQGLIMTTACIGNKISNYIVSGEEDKARELMLEWHEIFGDRFYLEIQPLNIDAQTNTNIKYMQWAKDYGIKIIATNDVHYADAEDHDDHDTLLCIGTGKKKSEEKRMRYSNDFWVKNYEEMIEGFEAQSMTIYGFINESYMDMCIQALENTNELSDRISDDIKLGSDEDLFPDLDIPDELSAEDYLTKLCFECLYRFKKRKPDIDINVYENRLNYELEIINSKGFAPYMLTVYEYVNWCDMQKIPVGPGRGSAAGSLVLFVLEITKIIDPIEYDLLFFRFLTMDRTSPPDIDLDFSFFGRPKLIQHLKEKYGDDNVCNIGTYTTMGIKSGLKDIGRVLDVDFSIMNSISKKIDEITDKEPSLKFRNLDELALSKIPRDKTKFEQFKNLENEHAELFRLARKFEGIVRNMGVHASGILITPKPVTDLFPTRYDDKKGITVALYTGPQLESLKAIKVDILGLKTLDVLDLTVKSINKDSNLEDYYNIVKNDDKKVFKMIKNKETDGLFQIESNLFKGLCDSIKPDNIRDITAITSIG